MGLFDEIVSGALSIVEGIASAAIEITSAFSSPQMARVTRFIADIGPALKPFIQQLPLPGPAIAIVAAIVVDIIPAVARALLGDVPKTETAETLGRKVERAADLDMEPEDFNSTEEFLNHVRENIPDETPEFFEVLDEKERLKYASVGSGLYVKTLEEKYGLALDPAFWNAVSQSGMRNMFSMEALIESLKANGVTDGSLLDDFFAGRLQNDPYEYGCVEKSLQEALFQKLGDVGADVLRGQINACMENYRRNLSGQGANA